VWCSPDGSHIMFASFNDTNVGIMSFPWFSSSKSSNIISSGSIFPETRTIRYPTPGTSNPEVQLWIYDVTNFTDIQKFYIQPPLTLDGQ